MDGLVSGLMLIAALAMMLLAYIAGSSGRAQYMLFPFVEGSEELMVVAGSIAGSCLGFLWFNCSPARVFMGDTGSLPLGGLLALIACALRQEIMLVVIGAVFYWELLSVMLQVAYFRLTGGSGYSDARRFTIFPSWWMVRVADRLAILDSRGRRGGGRRRPSQASLALPSGGRPSMASMSSSVPGTLGLATN